ncbi:hypothetical protein [Bradymonas sediminis]|uniref:hypothetical protein n=1 Tax=Bradymonas sediminis TaxID=1548548 RepID=UPI0010621464|nr:hypothetical protein [Bradymonas sediminis]TDP77468.1 hypothetical protein DFR33_101370 [Bradymonas sediminis]
MGLWCALFEDITKSVDRDLVGAQVRACLGIAAALAQGGASGDASAGAELLWVDWLEWMSACACAGIRRDEAVFEVILDHLVAGDLGRRIENGPSSGAPRRRWRFVTAEAVQALAKIAVEDKGWVRYHAACARGLLKTYGDDSHDRRGRVVAGRRAQHLIAGRRVDEALEMLLVAQKVALDSDDHLACRAYLDQRDRLLDEMEVGPGSPFRAQNDTRRARSYFLKGEIPRAQELVDRALRVFRRSDWAAETGYAMLLYGQIRTGQCRYADALRLNDDACGYLAVAGDEHGLTRARANRAYVMMLQGRYVEAREGLLKAVATFEALDDYFMQAVNNNFIAQTWLGEGKYTEAVRYAELSRKLARERGFRVVEGTAWTVFGEIARHAEDWEQARHHYAKALDLFQVDNSRPAHVARYNIALVEIGAQNFECARPVLIKLIMSYVELGYQSKLPLIYAGLMVCALGRGDWAAWDESLARFEDSLAKISGAHEDLAWLAVRGLRYLDAVEDGSMSEDGAEFKRRRAAREVLYTLACQQNDLLGNSARLSALRATYADASPTLVAQSY